MIRLLYFLLISAVLFKNSAFAQTSALRTKYNFNSDWSVQPGESKSAKEIGFNDAGWKKVTLPYAWNEDDAFKKDITDHSTGIVWYRKHFKLPASAKGQKVFLEFEGIRQAGDFYINGEHIGMHENGIMAFGFDITDLVKVGNEENVIAARIDNDWEFTEKATKTKFQWEDKNFNANYGGINKNVFLHITPRIYQTLPLFSNLKTTGVYVYADKYDIKGRSAVVHAESEIKNETGKTQEVSYEVSVSDLKGKLLKTFFGEKANLSPDETRVIKASTLLTGLNFWSWGYGYLYDVRTVVKIAGKPVDVVTTKTGFRKTAFQNGMIYLNDRVIMVHGYAQRTSNEWPAVGLSVPAWLSDYSNGLMVESGGNLVRWMHTTPWKQDIESCDRVGLMQAMPAGDAEHDIEGVQWEQRKAVMQDAIIYNRNNPSIIFYESGNESISEQHMAEMKAIRDLYDPHGGRAIGSREMLNSKVAEYGGEMLYTNKSAGIPMWAMEYSRDEGSRKYWDELSPPYHKDGDGPDTYRSVMTNTIQKRADSKSYNRNMDSHAIENVKRWYEFWVERPGTGRRVSSGGVNIVFSETNTHYRGEQNFRRSGEVDAMRIKKENYYAHKVMWDGWVVPEKYNLHIIGHWNYKPGVQKDIYVISSSEKVELKVNGKSMGFGNKSDGFLFTFKNIGWEAGNISASGLNNDGKIVCGDTITTAGSPFTLRLKPVERPTKFLANGHDLALIEVEVVDAKGNRCPTALNMVNYSMSGPGEWRGGIAMGPENYILKKSFPVEGGVNRFLIRSTTQPGSIVIKASSPGLREASISLKTIPFNVKNGLAEQLPSFGLPSKTDRGATPSTPSFGPTRVALNIASVNAGANTSAAVASYDDNELSDWVNDGTLSTAWIEYTLKREATVSEITLKLNNFTSKTYPLLITVDGKQAFRGSTHLSKGYNTITCNPHKGKKVRIQLIDAANTVNVNLGVEVSGKKLEDGIGKESSESKGLLSIIEAEIYESL